MRRQQFVITLEAALEHRSTVIIVQFADILRIVHIIVKTYTAGNFSDRNSRIAVPGIHDVHELWSILGVLVGKNAQYLHNSLVLIFIEHIQSQRIVHVVTYISVENNPDRLIFYVSLP